MLFKVSTTEFYGFIGSLFGIVYFLVKFFDLGLNKALIADYSYYSQSQSHFFTFLVKNITPNIILYTLSLATIFSIKYWLAQKMPFIASLDFFLIVILAALIATESIKTTFKRLLQLTHCFRPVALCEITFIICYQLSMWTYYFSGNSLTVAYVFASCFALSLCEIVGLFILLRKKYLELPKHINNSHPNGLVNSLTIKTRFFSHIHAMGKQFFSANILVPLFAHSFGYEYAALLKITSYGTHSITAILEKITDPSSSALFAHIKNDSQDNKQNLFLFALHVSYHALLCVLIFAIINGTKLFSITSINFITLSIILYFALHYCENFFIVIERFYIAHGRSEFLLINTMFNLAIGLMSLFNLFSPIISLALLLLSRFVSFFILLFYLSYLWGIKHRVTISPRYIIGALLTSIIFFVAN